MLCLRFYLIFLLALLFGSCFPLDSTDRNVPYKMPLSEKGEVILYLQPLPQQADKLRFIIDEIVARRDDGFQMSLPLSFREFKGSSLSGHQKMLASGALPPGSYTGVSLRVAKAFIETQDGEMALLVPEQPVAVDHPFLVTRKNASTLFLSFNASKFITGEIRFTPGFALVSPGRGLINLTGLVSNSESHIISIFDKKAMQVVDAIATDEGPAGLVLDQIRARAYVAAARNDTIQVIDVFKRQLVNRLKLNFRDRPIELALTPDGRTLVSVNQGSNTVSIIDTASMAEVRRIQVGEGPTSAVVDPAGLKAYILNERSSTISLIDLTQQRLAVTISVEAPPLRGAFSRNGSKLYVISSDSPNLAVVDLARFIVSQKIFIGMGAVSITVDKTTGQIYVGKQIEGEIAVIDPFSAMFIDAIRIDGTAVFLAIDGEERNLLALLADKNVLQKINLIGKKPIAELEVGAGAFAVVVMGEN